MKDRRPGESLWLEWDDDESVTYFTHGHVDLSDSVVRRALASALQRDGVVDSLGQGFKAVEAAETALGYVGRLPEEEELSRCDADGETYQDGMVELPTPATFVVVSV